MYAFSAIGSPAVTGWKFFHNRSFFSLAILSDNQQPKTSDISRPVCWTDWLFFLIPCSTAFIDTHPSSFARKLTWGQSFCFLPKFPKIGDCRGYGWYLVKLLKETYKRWKFRCDKSIQKLSEIILLHDIWLPLTAHPSFWFNSFCRQCCPFGDLMLLVKQEAHPNLD